MKYSFKFEIPGIPPIFPNKPMHWAKKAKIVKQWKFWVMACVAGKKPKAPLKKAKLVLTRFSSVEPDPDNLMSSFKCIVDGLRFAGVIENDRRANVGNPICKWKKASREEGKIRVEVMEI